MIAIIILVRFYNRKICGDVGLFKSRYVWNILGAQKKYPRLIGFYINDKVLNVLEIFVDLKGMACLTLI